MYNYRASVVRQHHKGSNQINCKELIMASNILTQEELKAILHYDQETGIFTRVSNGKEAGSKHKSGYIRIKITSKRSYLAHRLAWLYVTGENPTIIDHINGDGYDNRFCNLRNVSNSENLQNIRSAYSRNSCGLLGAHKSQGKHKYSSSIWHNGEKTFLGYFESPEEAHTEYLKAKRMIHKFCTI
jgi:hypothetical protein